jgi:hypothetical protein
MKKLFVVTTCVLATFCAGASAQRVAVKTNLLADATLSPNVGVEVGVKPKWTIDLTGEMNAWTLSHDRRWKHWYVQPEARYWLCDRFAGHFFAGHIFGGQYNLGNLDNGIKFLGTDFSKLSDYRFQGWFVGAGIGYGYSWILGRHWNIEAEIAVGYAYSRYDRYKCEGCGAKVANDRVHNYVGPTKAAVNLIYEF